MLARIYQPARNAMQAGKARTDWVLEFDPAEAKRIDPLMGWTGSGDMRRQVRMKFPTKEAAVAYAEGRGLPYQVENPKRGRHIIKPGGYGGNYAYNRRGAWTH
ncbi:ETC complex I subunit [Pikeienuella sp. HZG-20]|uniref:ETC complex I subunit n=1 Tax=Paludibacillus litoralis TaxID=3133267 RepID=UPI0030EB6A9B